MVVKVNSEDDSKKKLLDCHIRSLVNVLVQVIRQSVTFNISEDLTSLPVVETAAQ